MHTALTLNPTRLGPTEAEEIAELDSFERKALSQGIILEGRVGPTKDECQVIARRADTGERLFLSFPVSLRMADNPAEFTAALEKLLAEAVAALVSK